MKGVAFKVNYNDGGANGGLIGYRGVCSDRIIVQNVRIDPRPWCSDKGCACRRYCDDEYIKNMSGHGAPSGYPCYESSLLEPSFSIRERVSSTRGRKQGPPCASTGVDKGDIAFLTTIPPEDEQEDRIIFGCYRVGEISGDDDDGYFVESDGMMDVRLPDDIARDCFYWDYQKPNERRKQEMGFWTASLRGRRSARAISLKTFCGGWAMTQVGIDCSEPLTAISTLNGQRPLMGVVAEKAMNTGNSRNSLPPSRNV